MRDVSLERVVLEEKRATRMRRGDEKMNYTTFFSFLPRGRKGSSLNLTEFAVGERKGRKLKSGDGNV